MLTEHGKSRPGWPCCQVGSCLSSQSRQKQTRVSRQDTSCPSGCSSLLPPRNKIVSSNGSWPCHFPSGPPTLLLKTRQSPHHHALSWSSSPPGNHGGLQFRPRNLQIPAQSLLLTWKFSSSRPSSESGACSVSFKLSLSTYPCSGRLLVLRKSQAASCWQDSLFSRFFSRCYIRLRRPQEHAVHVSAFRPDFPLEPLHSRLSPYSPSC